MDVLGWSGDFGCIGVSWKAVTSLHMAVDTQTKDGYSLVDCSWGCSHGPHSTFL